MRLLWISPRWPFPDDSGAKKATYGLLRSLPLAAHRAEKKLIIDLVCVHEKTDSIEEFKKIWSEIMPDGRVLFCEKAAPLGGHVGLSYIWETLKNPRLPFTVARCASELQVRAFQQWGRGTSWDYTVVDGLHAVAFLQKESSLSLGHGVYRSHNVETELWQQMRTATKNPLKALALKGEEARCFQLEKEVCQKSHRVFTVSQEDALKYKNLGMTEKALALPIGIPLPQSPLPWNEESAGVQLLFVGRLDWLPNVQGLKWFLEKVWPFLPPKFSLQIVGSGDSHWLDSYLQDRVSIHRQVPSLRDYYQKSHLTLIPLLMGSGTRVKAIESGAYGRSFLSTTVGAEGLLFKAATDYWQSDSARQWIEILNSVTMEDLKKRSDDLFRQTAQFYSEESLSQKFLDSI